MPVCLSFKSDQFDRSNNQTDFVAVLEGCANFSWQTRFSIPIQLIICSTTSRQSSLVQKQGTRVHVCAPTIYPSNKTLSSQANYLKNLLLEGKYQVKVYVETGSFTSPSLIASPKFKSLFTFISTFKYVTDYWQISRLWYLTKKQAITWQNNDLMFDKTYHSLFLSKGRRFEKRKLFAQFRCIHILVRWIR